MTPSRQTMLIDSLTGIARRVFDAVPIAEEWSAARISGEVSRVTGSRPDFNIVKGCLNSLCESKLVVEKQRGLFTRAKTTKLKEAIEVPKPQEAPTPAPPPETHTADPLVKAEQMSAAVRRMASDLLAIAKEIEDLALNVEQRIAEVERDVEKMRQLQSLLKSIGT